MFARISRRYDRFNTINSLGIHRRWRNELVRHSKATADSFILDCATGTGDVAFAFERALGPAARIVGVDFCPEMLAVAREKRQKRASGVVFQEPTFSTSPFRTEASTSRLSHSGPGTSPLSARPWARWRA